MLRRLFRSVGTGKLVFLWVVSLLFGLSSRAGENTSILIQLLSVLNDQYYFIFAVLPAFLFLCAGAMEDDALLTLLRYGTYGRYFFKKWRALAVISTILWLGQIVSLLLSSAGLSLEGGWNFGSGPLDQEIAILLSEWFSTPLTAFLCCAGQLLLGYWLTSFAVLWIGHFFNRSTAVKLLMGSYIFAVLWIKLPVMSQPPLVFLTGFNHWILLLHNLAEPWRLPLTAVTTAALVILMIWFLRFRWRRHIELPKRRRNGLASYYCRILFAGRNVLLLAGFVFLTAGWSWLRGGKAESSTEWLVLLFAGHGTGFFYPMGFLVLLMSVVLPLWPLCALCTRIIDERCAFLMIRLSRRSEMMTALLRTASVWIFVYGGFLAAAAVFPSVAQKIPLDLKLMAAAVGLKMLDAGLQFLVILVVLCLTGQVTAGFLTVVLMNLLCVFPIPWLPFGISSLSRLDLPQTGGTVSIFLAGGLLTAAMILLLIWLYNLGIRRLFEREGV